MRAFKLAFIAAVAAFLVACGGSNEPKSVAIKYTENMLNGKVEKVLPLINMPTKDPFCGPGKGECKDLSEQEKQAWEKQIEGKLLQMSAEITRKVESKGGFDRVEFVGEEVEGDKALVNLKIHFKDGSNVDDKVSLERVDGKWKVNPK